MIFFSGVTKWMQERFTVADAEIVAVEELRRSRSGKLCHTQARRAPRPAAGSTVVRPVPSWCARRKMPARAGRTAGRCSSGYFSNEIVFGAMARSSALRDELGDRRDLACRRASRRRWRSRRDCRAGVSCRPRRTLRPPAMMRAADIGQQHAVAVFVEILVAAGVLHRLEGDAAHAFATTSAWRTMSPISLSLTPFLTTRRASSRCRPPPDWPAPAGGLCADRRRGCSPAPRALANRTADRPRNRGLSSASSATNAGRCAIRMPLVLSMMCRIGLRLRQPQDREDLRDGLSARRR